MFNFGFYEWVMIVVAVIVCIRPADFPRFFKHCGKLVRKCDIFWKNLSNQFDIYDD